MIGSLRTPQIPCEYPPVPCDTSKVQKIFFLCNSWGKKNGGDRWSLPFLITPNLYQVFRFGFSLGFGDPFHETIGGHCNCASMCGMSIHGIQNKDFAPINFCPYKVHRADLNFGGGDRFVIVEKNFHNPTFFGCVCVN